ncbi:hypothetical protein ScalyP_jg4829 [Parmales sp. scaly parma]|nr:hypothetical protein ScalyP_jg4829 [Parmales sp. scaly parma]|tara:strand:- start:248 stop:658 length:411 start_codon:yes stop_codon:yes gene_type:complete
MADRFLNKSFQDMPPPGGYPDIQIKRRTPARGPSGAQIWLGFAAFVSYGFYTLGQSNIKRNAERMEQREARSHLAPMLQAEHDWHFIKAKQKELMNEAVVMRGNKAWKVGENVYKGFDENGVKIYMTPYNGVNNSR